MGGAGSALAQQSISGRITDENTGEGVALVRVKLYRGGEIRAAANSDVEGYYSVDVKQPGSYDSLVFSPFGGEYFSQRVRGLVVGSGQELRFAIKLSSNATVVEVFFDPNLNVKKTTQEKVVDNKDLMKTPAENLGQIVTTQGGVVASGSGFSVRGSRDYNNLVIVDGIRQRNLPNLPRNGVAEISIMTGGIPAEFGDLTGGVISIRTRGMSDRYTGSVEARTSSLTDQFGYQFLEGTFTGPILFRDSAENKLVSKRSKNTRPVLGFFLSGNVNYQKVAAPPSIDMYQVKSDVLERLENDPLIASPQGGFVSTANFITKNDLYTTRVKPNTQRLNYSFTGKLNFAPTENIDITLGGVVDRTDANAYIYTFNLFNAKYNPQTTGNNYRLFGRYEQRFLTSPESVIQNPYYSLQADMIYSNGVTQDRELKDNVWAYGYIGQYNRKFTPVYQYSVDTINGNMVQANYLLGYSESDVTFKPGSYNPILANYTRSYFDAIGSEAGAGLNFAAIQAGGGLINGQSPQNIYSLWSSPGTRYNSYSRSESQQIFVNLKGGFTIQGKARGIDPENPEAPTRRGASHRITLGLQYQSNTSRAYTVGSDIGANGLWTLGRQYLNRHLTQLNRSNPVPVYDKNGIFTDTVNYTYVENSGAQSTFDRNFRNHLISIGARDENGKLIDSATLINLDRYSPDELKMSWFSPDELLNNGTALVETYGYDFQGNKLKGKTTLADYLDATKRYTGAYNPIYTAGYIQDEFQLNDITFRLGLRIDRFDANQRVLADPYTLYPIKSVNEVSQIGNRDIIHPGNIGKDYKVYVDDEFNPTKVVGYRNGSTWYDATGAEVADPNQIALSSNSGRISPYLQERNKTNLALTESSFTDYKPQVNLLPRLSFAFPISNTSQFYANYDVLTQRPVNNFTTFEDYYFLQQRATKVIANPDLKPERRTNYELGFNQGISNRSSISITAYYGQIKDLVQRYQFVQAYPITYTTFNNIDFGTVKGFTFGYNLVRSGGYGGAEAPSGVELNGNYTLQFAEGTGSGANSGANLIAAGQPNLRTPFPLDYDVRHVLTGIFDYRFGSGKQYSGFTVNGKQVLANAGINFLFNARSGTPYSRQSNVTVGEGVEIGVAGRSSLAGTINGSRLPWQFRLDARIDKDFVIYRERLNPNTGLREQVRAGTTINVFAFIQNVLDARNIVRVYRYTGLPDDDGYLNSQLGQREADQSIDRQAFLDQYSIKMNNPDNYINPRFFRIGALVTF